MGNREGQQLGHYRLVRLLGQGGFADVYLGQHLHLNTQAALKILQMRLVGSNLEQFRAEAQAIASLVHPHIIRVLDFGIEEGVPFLVMDYAPGDTLRSRHPKGTRVPLAAVVSYIQHLADALQYAHSKKLIHRDVKPENMLVGQNDEVLLSDFGLVLIAQSSGSRSTKEIAGTVPYMAPEQIQGKPREASDQYALGIVTYEWLTGTPPFQGSALEIYGQHIYASPPSLREQVPSISSSVEEVILKALSKDPQQRFAGVKAFATALEEAHQLTTQDSVELPTLTPEPAQLSQSLAVKTPPAEPAEPTLIKTPSDEVTKPVLSETAPIESTEPTLINTPPGEVTELDLTRIPMDGSTEPTFVKTPLDESSEPTFMITSPEESTEPTVTKTPPSLSLELGSVSATAALSADQSSPTSPNEELLPTGISQESADPRRGKIPVRLAVVLALLVLVLIFGGIASALPGGRAVLHDLSFGRSSVSSNHGVASGGLPHW